MLHCPRTFARTIAFSGLFLATVVSPALAADPTGDWKVADGVATIRVAQCNGNMWGAVSWEKTPGGKELLVSTTFHETTLVDDENSIRIPDR